MKVVEFNKKLCEILAKCEEFYEIQNDDYNVLINVDNRHDFILKVRRAPLSKRTAKRT